VGISQYAYVLQYSAAVGIGDCWCPILNCPVRWQCMQCMPWILASRYDLNTDKQTAAPVSPKNGSPVCSGHPSRHDYYSIIVIMHPGTDCARSHDTGLWPLARVMGVGISFPLKGSLRSSPARHVVFLLCNKKGKNYFCM
jgi:hypothetical protein